MQGFVKQAAIVALAGMMLLLPAQGILAQGAGGGTPEVLEDEEESLALRRDAEPGADGDAAAPGDGGTGGAPGPEAGGAGDAADAADEGSGDAGLEERVKSVEERIREARGQIGSLRDQVAENARAIEELRLLLEKDREAEPRPGEGLPPMKVDCGGDPECHQCLIEVAKETADLLMLFERLATIYSRFKDTYEYAIVVGDMLSAYHSISETVWGSVKAGMAVDLKGLQYAYDEKFDEFMGRYDDILKQADACLPPQSPRLSTSYDARIFRNMLRAGYKRKD